MAFKVVGLFVLVTVAVAAALVLMVFLTIGDARFAMAQYSTALVKAAPAGLVTSLYFIISKWNEHKRRRESS